MRPFLHELRKAVPLFRPMYLAVSPFLKVLVRDDLIEPGPETFVADLVSSLTTAADRIDVGRLDVVARGLLGTLATPSIRAWVRGRVERELASDREKLFAGPRHRPYLDYLDDLERRLPGAAVLIFAMEWIAPTTQRRMVDWVESYFFAQRFVIAKGETKARLLRDLVRSSLVHHERWLRHLSMLERLARGRPVANDLAYGAVADNLSQWLPSALQPLVCRDAVHWRNAASHPGGWLNEDNFESVKLCDVGRRGQVWTRTTSNAALYESLDRLVEEINALHEAVRVKASTEMFAIVRSARLLDMVLDAAGIHPTGVTKDMFDDAMKRYFEPMKKSFDVSTAAATTDPAT